MESWSFGRRAAMLAVALFLAVPSPAESQAISAAEREALVRLQTDRGGRAEDIQAVIRIADEAAAKGLPVAPLINKIREGLAKGVAAGRIEPVVRQMIEQLGSADALLRDVASTASDPGYEASVALLADALAGGVTAAEVRALRQAAIASGTSTVAARTATGDELASAAKSLSFIKEAKLSVADGTAVVAEAVRHQFRSSEILDLGREIKRREVDFRTGRESLRSIRDAIARGERPGRLFREARATTGESPASARPEPPARTPERPTRPEVPARPERPERPATGRDR